MSVLRMMLPLACTVGSTENLSVEVAARSLIHGSAAAVARTRADRQGQFESESVC